MKRAVFLYVCVCGCLSAAIMASEKTSSELSYYLGYRFWKDWTEKTGMPLDVNEAIKGIQAAQEGKDFSPEDEIALREALTHAQETIWEGRAKANLDQAEKYLSQIARDPAIHEIVKGKLYYSILQEGKGNSVLSGKAPLLAYSLSILDAHGNKECISKEAPFRLRLDNTITGFQKGITGMKPGEKREIFIHPDLGYGPTGRWNANGLLIFEVEILEAAS